MGNLETYFWALHYHVYVKLANNKPVTNCDPDAIKYFSNFIKNNPPN